MNATTADPIASTFALPENVGLTAPAPPLEGAAMNPVPGWMDVLREQLASAGLALKREGTIVGGFAVLFTAFIAWTQVQHGFAEIPFSPKEGIAAAMMALLIPMAVWKGEDPARRGYHHAMPVSHGAHASARVAAGLAWTLAGVTAFFGWMGILSLSTGGSVDAAAEPWQWLAPFAGATVMYLLGSALTLATSRPWRWLGGGMVGYLFLGALRGLDATEPITAGINALLQGHLGLTTVLTGLVWEVTPMKHAWLPDAGAWLTATFIWLAVAVSLFFWAAYRQPEQ
ncbi:MAG TPA: hypothetical protein VGO40_07780 [Longimicrobium sp.]|jgi:hypothetical protein|nr:hypothetical protein [Longimicrobium sp.]